MTGSTPALPADRRPFRPVLPLVLAGALLLGGCGTIVRGIGDTLSAAPTVGRQASLTPVEREWARIAWQYFEGQYRPETGLVDSAPNYAFASPGTMGDVLAATVAAERLGLIPVERFDTRVHQLLAFLQRMPLSEDRRPARGYHTREGRLADHGLEEADPGTSAVELGRLLIWLDALRGMPRFAPFVTRAVGRWNLCAAADSEGTLVATFGGQALYQGTAAEQAYAAEGFRRWGCDVDPNVHARRFADSVVEGVVVPAAGARPDGARSATTATAYLLQALEYGGGEDADAVREAQERRWARTGMATARANYVRSEPPHFVENAIAIDGMPWAVQTADGAPRDDLALISTGAGFAQWALHRGEAGDALIATLRSLRDPDRGWYEGRYEVDGLPAEALSAATNAMVLQALLYRRDGALLDDRR